MSIESYFGFYYGNQTKYEYSHDNPRKSRLAHITEPPPPPPPPPPPLHGLRHNGRSVHGLTKYILTSSCHSSYIAWAGIKCLVLFRKRSGCLLRTRPCIACANLDSNKCRPSVSFYNRERIMNGIKSIRQ